MIEMAPIQMWVFGFHDASKFTPAIMQEVESLQKRGLIRLIDLLYVERLDDGSLVTHEMSGLTPGEVEEFGGLLNMLLGLPDESTPANEASERARQSDGSELFYGITRADMAGVIDDIPAGGAAVMALFEHSWAFDIRNKIRRATGYPIAQGFLTPELLMLIGEEVRMMHDAAVAVQLGREARSAALLDALESIANASSSHESSRTDTDSALRNDSRETVAQATATVRALIEGGFLQEAEAGEAIEFLVRKELIDSGVLSSAERLVETVNPN